MRAARKVSPLELYRLRWLTLYADKKALEAQRAQNMVRELLLRLEAKYCLLASEASLDIHTGLIIRAAEEVSGESVRDEDAGSQGPA